MSDEMNLQNLSPEITGKLRQFKRLIMSYGDFKHARLVADYILEGQLHAKYPDESYVTLPALSCSMIIAYCRPFSGNDARTIPKVPDLPKGFLSVLNDEERAIHEVILRDRDKVLAHSDSDALDPEPVVMRLDEERHIVVPLTNWGLAPLTEEATRVLRSAASKLLEATLNERRRLEPELKQFFRVVALENLYDPPEYSPPNPAAPADQKAPLSGR